MAAAQQGGEGETREDDAQINAPSEKQEQDVSPDANGAPKGPEDKEQNIKQDGSDEKKDDGPAGGYDDTSAPRMPTGTIGYTIKITMHKATDLAIGDPHVLSSDPYVLAQINTGLDTRHKEDPKLRFRTHTERKTTDPEWNEDWIVANVPSSGFKIKMRVYDEDPADHDDLLGKIHITIPSLQDGWEGIKKQPYRLRIRDSSKRATMIRAVTTCFRITSHMRGELYVSIELLGRTEVQGDLARAYTVGPCKWIRHYSPMLGRIAHTKEPKENDEAADPPSCPVTGKERDISKYNFQANQMQLEGPVPTELYHRFVEFKPWVKRMFTTSGLQGVVLGKALHHQHSRVYNFGRSTIWGTFPQGPCIEMTKQFLDLVHYDKGGRIFTYVLTLDALLRFTETGKEFGIDMLSKHTMHSDVSIYIAFSGEFFIRRLKHKNRPPPPHPVEETSQQHPPDHSHNEEHPPEDIEDGPPDKDPPTDPRYYELVIDNDSGTYRPNAKLLPVLASFLAKSFPGLHIQTLDCQADAKKMEKMKNEQRELKKKEGDQIIYTQDDDSSSISSSEDERLQEVEDAYQLNGEAQAGGGSGSHTRRTVQQIKRDASRKQEARTDKFKRTYGSRRREGSSRKVVGEGGGVDEEQGEGGAAS